MFNYQNIEENQMIENQMILYRNVKEGTFVLTDQEERVIKGTLRLNFKGWMLELDPEVDLYLNTSNLLNQDESQALKSPRTLSSIEDSSIRNLNLYSSSGESYQVNPEQIGLKWTFVIQNSPAIQLEKQAFLAGPKAICWVPNLKAAAALQLEGWEISSEKWPLAPEVSKKGDGDETQDVLSSSDFCLNWDQTAWVRVGGAFTDYNFSEMHLYHHSLSGLTGCQYFHFSYGDAQDSSDTGKNKLYYDLIEVTLDHAVQKSGGFSYTLLPESQPRSSSSSSPFTIGTFGPRPGAFRWKNQFYLNDPYRFKFPFLFQKIFEEQNPDRLVTGLSEGWDFMMALEALGRGIPITIVWTDVVQFEWNSRLINLKEVIFKKSEVIEIPNTNPYFGNYQAYFKSPDYEQFRLDQLRERDSKIVDQSDLIVSGYPKELGKEYYALQYAKLTKKPITHYWEDLLTQPET